MACLSVTKYFRCEKYAFDAKLIVLNKKHPCIINIIIIVFHLSSDIFTVCFVIYFLDGLIPCLPYPLFSSALSYIWYPTAESHCYLFSFLQAYEKCFQNLHYVERYEEHTIAHAIQTAYKKTKVKLRFIWFLHKVWMDVGYWVQTPLHTLSPEAQDFQLLSSK